MCAVCHLSQQLILKTWKNPELSLQWVARFPFLNIWRQVAITHLCEAHSESENPWLWRHWPPQQQAATYPVGTDCKEVKWACRARLYTPPPPPRWCGDLVSVPRHLQMSEGFLGAVLSWQPNPQDPLGSTGGLFWFLTACLARKYWKKSKDELFQCVLIGESQSC